ncbi:MAG: hypothetical protein RML95_12800 [Anaerolineae bacterium]|nr:hypothetical protein [Anaerolineae bacterium]
MSIEDGYPLSLPHVLYHVLLILLKNMLSIESARDVSLILAVLLRVGLGVILFLAIRQYVPKHLSNSVIVAAVILLLLSAPIYLFDRSPYLSYINYLPYHNPTQNMMLVFAVPVSLIALRAVVPKPFSNLNQRVFFTLLSVLAVLLLSLSKPSYSIALLPALGLAVLYRLVRRQPVDWLLLILGLGVPFMLMLGIQYLVTYNAPENASIGIGWLMFYRLHRYQAWEVAVSLLLSVLFPLSVYVLYVKQAVRDAYLNFSWLVFGVSLVWSYFFFERGDRDYHGNFVWSAYVALFMLVFNTFLFVIKQYAATPLKLSWRTGIIAMVLCASLVSGAITAYRIANYNPVEYLSRATLTNIFSRLYSPECGMSSFFEPRYLSALNQPTYCY